MPWPRLALLFVRLVISHRIREVQSEAKRLLEAVQERATRDAEADRTEVLQQIQDCDPLLRLNGQELIRKFVDEIHRPAPLTINFDADRWVEVAEKNEGAEEAFTSHVQNIWQVAMLPHPPVRADRTQRSQQVYGYANERYDTEKWFFGFTQAPEKLSSAMERPVSAAPGLFQAGQKNGNAVNSAYGYSALFLAPHVWNRSTIIGQDLKVSFTHLGRPKDYDATFPELPVWGDWPEVKVTDPILQIPNLQAAGGLPYLGTFQNPVAGLKTVSCYELQTWTHWMEGKTSYSPNYLEVNIFGGVTFAEDVEKVVINVPLRSNSSRILALNMDPAQTYSNIWKALELQHKNANGATNVSMTNSTPCKMWRLARSRKIRRISWCLSIDEWRCIRETDATADVSCDL